jgi:hypothetical protein
MKKVHGNTGENNVNWKGGVSEYPGHSEFKRNRLIKLQQANYKCEKCKNKKAVYVHHIDNSKSNHKLSNLMALCAKCHCTFHKGGRPTKYGRLPLHQMAEESGISVYTIRKYFNNANSINNRFLRVKLEKYLKKY